MTRQRWQIAGIMFGVVTATALGGSHTWDVNEVFSNADGSIQFIELRENNGTPGEIGVGGHTVTSDIAGKSFTIPSNVVSPTSNRHLLLASASFAALPGAPTPDHIIPAGSFPFFALAGDTVRYNPWDAFTFGAVPTDGVMSMNDGGIIAANSPTNYAGETGSVDASGGSVPGDFDGDGDLDLVDFEQYVDCHAGPGAAPAPSAGGVTSQDCVDAFDRNADNDVDAGDFQEFQTGFTGPLP